MLTSLYSQFLTPSAATPDLLRWEQVAGTQRQDESTSLSGLDTMSRLPTLPAIGPNPAFMCPAQLDSPHTQRTPARKLYPKIWQLLLPSMEQKDAARSLLISATPPL